MGETSELEIRHRKVKLGILEETLDIQFGRYDHRRPVDVIGFVHRVKRTNKISGSEVFGSLASAQPPPSCSFARHLVGKMDIFCSFAHH